MTTPQTVPDILRCTLVVVGDPTVGKTALVHRFVGDAGGFNSDYVVTTGCNYHRKTIYCSQYDMNVEFYILDVGGQPLYETLRKNYLKQASAVMCVYDASEEKTFNSLPNWIREVTVAADRSVPGIIVANKMDIRNATFVDVKKATDFAAGYEMEVVECSARDNTQTSLPFEIIAREYCKHFLEIAESLKLI